jgi:small subunit ribosomal protein S20
MPHTASAWKRLRKSERQRRRNRATIKGVKTETKAVATAIVAGDPSKVGEAMKAAAAKLDKAAARGVIHKNKAARLKSRMAKKLANLGKQPAAAKA